MTQRKLEVYFNEYNVLMVDTVYLPLVSGSLQAYAQTQPVIDDNYEFMPFIFIRDRPETILAEYRTPAVAAFSVSMWNINLSLEVACRIKTRFPECLIVFGGPQVPFQASDFMARYAFIDVAVRGEGERTFAALLTRFFETRDFGGIPGLSYRSGATGALQRNDQEAALAEDLDVYPSPYLEGVYDDLMKKDLRFQAIVETNRGCPFGCSYCFWGQAGLNKRVRRFGLDRVRRVAEWCGEHKIAYVFCADSNFGMLKRDVDIARFFAATKARHGFPEKFRVCYAKNAEENVFEIGRLLTECQMEKGITMARQSNDQQVLANVGRKNIRMSVYNNLQQKYGERGIPTYTELILGLPDETRSSFLGGIEEILTYGPDTQLFVYLCQVYPNTDLADQTYRRKHGIETVSIPLTEIHGGARSDDFPPEYEEIVISTASMSRVDWQRTVVISWLMQLFHGLRLGVHLLTYLADRYHTRHTDFLEFLSCWRGGGGPGVLTNEIIGFHQLAAGILEGKSYCRMLPDFGGIYWAPEEASYLRVSDQKDAFYDDVHCAATDYLRARNLGHDEEQLREVIEYQIARVPTHRPLLERSYRFEHNLPEFFAHSTLKSRVALARRPQAMALKNPKDYGGDKMLFATDTVLRGRKSNKMLYEVEWSAPAVQEASLEEVPSLWA